MRDAIYYFLFPDPMGEALIIRGGFLATAVFYYLWYRVHVWACLRSAPFEGSTAVVANVINMPGIVQKVARLTPAELDEKEKRRQEMLEYVKPAGLNWPGSDKVTIEPLKVAE